MAEQVTLSPEEVEELHQHFSKIDLDGNNHIELSELRHALKLVGFDLPAYQIREIEESFKKSDKNQDGKLDFDEFQNLYRSLKGKKIESMFKKAVKPMEASTQISNKGITHTVSHSEELAFSKWINENLAKDPELSLESNPIRPLTKDLYTRCSDGLLLCKLINFAVPDTIDERSINKGKSSIYQQLENLELAIRSAESIGCCVVNIRAQEIKEGKEHLILGLVWQIIQIGLFASISLQFHPGLIVLLMDGETKEDLLKLSKEDLLLRWVNYHLEKSAYAKRISNFSSDIKDSMAYTYLLNQIAPSDNVPKVTLDPLNEKDLTKRAEKMLNEADKLNAREFVTPHDVTTGVQKLNMAFVANLFNKYPALDDTVEPDIQVEETREEKTFRNWINSVGISPRVNYIYTDLQDGIVIFKLYDIIKPGTVDWNKVVQNFNPKKAKFEKLNNCNYAVELGKKPMNFKLVGIHGSNLLEGHRTYTLALISQAMRAYTLSMLEKIAGQGNPIVESGIVEWANNKLKSAEKETSFANFQDPAISDSIVICDLIDSIRPSSIRYELLKRDGTPEGKLDNARYAISIARKIGARVYALPEDIVEVKSKMVMTVFATLMIKDYQK